MTSIVKQSGRASMQLAHPPHPPSSSPPMRDVEYTGSSKQLPFDSVPEHTVAVKKMPRVSLSPAQAQSLRKKHYFDKVRAEKNTTTGNGNLFKEEVVEEVFMTEDSTGTKPI
eukprot:TRINITY_DN10713_c0_g1_i1.p2 TRINITY_DN10713_c0_g1~~TRINITY_DN10713_c0_g1_i1.p2  ORF type:complete len:112 (+),score=29.13 TRINITY_DN10713_c0_g1_i1:350-685(+)